MILETFRPGQNEASSSIKLMYKSDNTRKKHKSGIESNIETLHESLQHSWLDAGKASPTPTLEPMVVKSRKMPWHSRVWIQCPEAVIMVEDLDWDKDNGQRLAFGNCVSERMIGCVSLWFDDENSVLKNFEIPSERAADEPARYVKGDNDILRNHLRNRTWVWITHKRRTGEEVIDISRTEAFYDARVAVFDHGNDSLLQNFCNRCRFSQRQVDKLPTVITDSIIGRLEQLIMISQSAWRKMKADPRDAATFGHWLDFLVNSVCNENDQISKAIRELDVAWYFLLHLRLLNTIGYLRYNFKPVVPEFSNLDSTGHLTRLMETLLASNEKDEAVLSTNQIHTIMKNFREGLFRRAKPGQVEWQQTGALLQGVASFYLRGEAECALILAAKRQQRE